MGLKKIIVLTPVKNEAWILQTFLEVTSQFADAIIIAYQKSEDSTLAIAQNYSKVILLDNPIEGYNETIRQQFLINKAREFFPGNNILLALDADEVASADSLASMHWDVLRSQPPGTLLFFRKIDLVDGGIKAISLPDTFYPLGFVDDGYLQHIGKAIHSVRIPLGMPAQPRLEVSSILFLHLQRLRPYAQLAKRRFYQVKEKDFGMNRWYWRRKRYNKSDFMGWKLPVKPTPANWLDFPEPLGINITALEEPTETWFDREVYLQLKKFGGRRYWLDDIWDKNWNEWEKNNDAKIMMQPVWLSSILRLADMIFNKLYNVKQKWFSKNG